MQIFGKDNLLQNCIDNEVAGLPQVMRNHIKTFSNIDKSVMRF